MNSSVNTLGDERLQLKLPTAFTEVFNSSGWQGACIATEVLIRDYLVRRGEVDSVGSEPDSDSTYTHVRQQRE